MFRLAKLKVDKCKDIRDWFLANAFADFGDPFTNFFMSHRLPKGFVEDDRVQKKVIEYFASFKVAETKTRAMIDKCLEMTAYDAQYRMPWIPCTTVCQLVEEIRNKAGTEKKDCGQKE